MLLWVGPPLDTAILSEARLGQPEASIQPPGYSFLRLEAKLMCDLRYARLYMRNR